MKESTTPDNIDAWSHSVIRAADQFVSQAASIAEINSSAIAEMQTKADAKKAGYFSQISKYLTAEDLAEFAQKAELLGHGLLEMADAAEKRETGKSFSLNVQGSAGAALMHLVHHQTRFINSDPQHQLLRNSLLVSVVPPSRSSSAA
ncbi:hypothetical protein [Streptomyces sp. NBC_00069]|uniref:hypothetical protein n=1 Tax=Streptomyces sp. NBC_00069 TaxID=2975639 RepID=UPI00324946A0